MKGAIEVLGLLLVLAASGHAQADRAPSLTSLTSRGSIPGDEISPISPTEHVTEISFQFYNNLIIVRGGIGSIKDLNIILDTGTSPTTVSRHIAERLNLRGNSELQMTVVLPRIQMGGLCADSVPVVVQDLSFLDQKLGIPVGGIAGLGRS